GLGFDPCLRFTLDARYQHGFTNLPASIPVGDRKISALLLSLGFRLF
ncbi:MAG: hypothetical protein HC880_14955, partial [Bacteroidia bacterium]|nr:hypothetical protein [Bacteroidia bacterium]